MTVVLVVGVLVLLLGCLIEAQEQRDAEEEEERCGDWEERWDDD